VNGDGYTDVAVGALEAGEAHLFLGGPDGVSSTPDVTMTAPAINDFGYFVARAGDVDADGFSDVLIGGSGGAQLFLGNSDGLLQVSNLDLLPPDGAGTEEFGRSVGSAGDVNGDDYADVLVGDAGAGLVYLYLGGPFGPDPSGPSAVLGSESAIPGFGFSLASRTDTTTQEPRQP